MDKHEEKYCPKCHNIFICKMGDIANCQCNTGEISEAAREFLSHTYFDCLCKDCLAKINYDVKMAKAYHFPTQKEMYIEGLHYYKEGSYWVFTELYHLLRGYCCESGCRHCVYGFKKD
ncbi:MAG: cysteine-rich CWC family protein [Bacteroidota bacterium]|nr:cysteine-rich CWC family protein [Bacteroidota bacterium]